MKALGIQEPSFLLYWKVYNGALVHWTTKKVLTRNKGIV